jgi:Putative sensor/Histidine kinase-, DNA gyrase B-, and HSP90-like ATPase/Histidine kinase
MTLDDMTATSPARLRGTAWRAVLRAPASRRAWRELLFCVAELPFVVPLPLLAFFLTISAGRLVSPQDNPAAGNLLTGLAVAVLLIPVLVVSGAARWLGGAWRKLAVVLLGERIPAPAPLPAESGSAGPLAARLRDRFGWRSAAYLTLKFPVAILGSYAVMCWVAGLVNVSFPLWWLSFRNHSPGVHLSPVPVFTPFGWFGRGTYYVSTFPGTFAAAATGVGMLFAAPWVTRAVVSADRWLIRGLLAPGPLRQRLRELEQTRALAVDDSAALLRQVERNLHDGAQIRLATLAMNLGMAKEKLGTDGEPADVTAVRDLVDAAHQGAKEALTELRELAKGIHPPVLDNGLADALATLAASSAIPVSLTAGIGDRPTPAIETIAYFCAAELLSNAVKHSYANQVTISARGRGRQLVLIVADDGTGGADPGRGSGLAGLAQRVRTVDGQLGIDSPAGGGTRVTVTLPLHA